MWFRVIWNGKTNIGMKFNEPRMRIAYLNWTGNCIMRITYLKSDAGHSLTFPFSEFTSKSLGCFHGKTGKKKLMLLLLQWGKQMFGFRFLANVEYEILKIECRRVRNRWTKYFKELGGTMIIFLWIKSSMNE